MSEEKVKYTPGDWYVKNGSLICTQTEDNVEEIVAYASYPRNDSDEPERDADEVFANAQLLAASKRLYVELKEASALYHMTNHGLTEYRDTCKMSTCQRYQAAISTVEGK